MATRFAVCPTCEGRGSIVNPAVDGNGISAEEMAELGDDFREDYLSGTYDVRCPECGGNRVVPVCGASRRVGHEVVICTAPVQPGTWTDYETDEDFEPGDRYEPTARPFSACYAHLTADERESVDDAANYAAEVAAEQRMGA